MRHQPLLVVLRASNPQDAAEALVALQNLGVRHVELAWRDQPSWVDECRELIRAFPGLSLGAASLCGVSALEAAQRAGFRYAVSPILDPAMLERTTAEMVLVPGVMTPTEVQRARGFGCQLVKLFPAVSVGPEHWRRLSAPLGGPLPFCIAAGGLGVPDVLPWLAAGVDAVALGSSLRLGQLDADDSGMAPMRELLAALERRPRRVTDPVLPL